MVAKLLLTRRHFVQMSALGAAAALAACAPKPAPAPTAAPAKPAATTAPAAAPTTAPAAAPTTAPAAAPTTAPAAVQPAAGKYQQNPIFDAEVAAGKLPPVDERLPVEPLVAPRKGQYGGTMRTCYIHEDPQPDGVRYLTAYFMPLRLNLDLHTTQPNHMLKIDASADGKTFTCYMRKGMKWSDGKPYTANDWIFWWNEIILNTDITAAVSPYFISGGAPLTMTKIDDYTLKIEYPAPKPSFPLISMAHTMGGIGAFRWQEEYCKKFLPKFNPNADAEAKKLGYADWKQYWLYIIDHGKNIELPKLGAYVIDKVVSGTTYFKPNPYFAMVDEDGKQLPYFEGLTMLAAADQSVLDTGIVTGKFDYVNWSVIFTNFQAYKDGEEKGNYNVVPWPNGSNGRIYTWNLNYPDPVWQAVFRDVRFRRAMSVAINRDEINNVVWLGLARPAQLTAHKTSRAYKEEYEKAWAQYDVALANSLLDDMGLKWDANKQWRLLKDGRPMEITYLISGAARADDELCNEYWAKIGVKVTQKASTRTLLLQATQGNQQMMSQWGGDEIMDILLCRRPKWFAARYGDETTQAPLWALWWETKGKQGEEPPDWYKPLYDWFDMYSQTDDVQWVDKILASNAENLWTIGTVVDVPSPRIHSKDFVNMAEVAYNNWDTFYGMEHWYEAWCFRNPEAHKL